MIVKRWFTHAMIVISALFFTTSCVVQENPVSGQKRAYAYSWQQEIQIGRDVDREIVAEYGLYDDERVAEYVVNIGEEVLSVSHMRRETTSEQFRNTEFTFRVLDSPVVNAFALPGGYVYVTRGLMAHLNNEAQFAVVMGHEIGHVAARHASQRGFQQTLGQVAVIGGAILGQELFGLPGETILNLSSTAAQFLFLSYSRDHERESDRLGVEYAAMKGYAAEEGAAFFTSLKRISEKAGHSIPNMLSTHPDPGERERTIPRLADEWREKGYEQNRLAREAYLEILDGMVFGDNPRQGYVEEGQFLHPDLEFYFPVPAQWRLINQPSQVVMVKGEGEAVMIMRIDSQSESARASVEQFTSQEGFERESSGSTVSSGQYAAYQAEGTIVQDGTTLGVHVYAVEFQDRIYRFINYTTQSAYDTHVDTFKGVTSGFSRLTDQSALNIRPVRIELVRVDREQQFRDFLPAELPMNIEPEDVAIINQVSLDSVIRPGTYLKIPVQ